MADATTEIKERLNIEDVVSEYVQLKRAGRNFKGLSPFTNEKTPSFIVSPDKQIWHDFSSSKGGDVISFIEQVEGLDFKGALELLARKAGIDLAQFNQQSGANYSQSKERLYKAVEAAVSYYQRQLMQNDAPLRYVREVRGYEKQTILDFRFGYAPNGSSNLKQALNKQGFSDEELLKAGLCVGRRGDIVDMFRNRLMIPLSDTQGRPVGFTARQLDIDKNAPKYINTPATILYDKSRQLFGFSQAKEHIRKSGYVVVVEGNLDVVASHQAGIKQVVASAGTALTTYHLKSLQRFTGDVRLAFDDDRAGQEAAERTIPLAQTLGIELSFISIPTGKDPDELIKQDVGQWLKIVEKPVYMVDWLIDRIAEQVDLNTAPGKRQFTTRVLEIVRQLKDDVEQEHYLRIVGDKTSTSLESIIKKFSDKTSQPPVRLKKPNLSGKKEEAEPTEHRILEQHFLAIVLAVPRLRTVLELVPQEVFSEQAKTFLVGSEQLETVKASDNYGNMLALLFEETYQHTNAEELDYQIRHLARRLIDSYTRYKKTNILNQLGDADEQEEKRLLAEVKTLEELKKRFK